jgi:polyphosphate kinase
MAKKQQFINREISWLSFNARVLQEAADESVPLVERFRFLGIFSNNMDEFFRVRVASMKRLVNLGRKVKSVLQEDPAEVLKDIQKDVIKLQKKFDKIYNALIKEAKNHKIQFVNELQLSVPQQIEIKTYFEKKVRSVLVPIMLEDKRTFPELKDKAIYLAVKLSSGDKKLKTKYALIEVPTAVLPRFYVLEGKNENNYLMLLDDIIRANLKDVFKVFKYDTVNAYAFKVTRDAELDMEDDISKSLVDILSKSIKNRKKGDPVRFVHDSEMDKDIIKYLLKRLEIKEGENIIAGGRYHNFKDFIDFPSVGSKKLRNTQLHPLPHPLIKKDVKLLDQIKKQDLMLNYPFQSFDYVIDLLRESAIDPDVTSIKINLYRVAKKSNIINALINAVQNGKKVTVVVELRARFDEQNNIYWSNKLQEAGVKLIFGVPGLKVHSKLIVITRKEKGAFVRYAHVGTGNFHEKTALLYGDTSLITADIRIADEVNKVFEFFENNYQSKRYSHLVVSPYTTRRKFVQLINNEIKYAKKREKAVITLKLNNLDDNEMIKKLYEASNAGVKITLIIRGICSIVPGVKGLSENIKVISIIDRFLEHSRILIFGNGGDELVYISSADWMARNLDRRVEVTTPIYDTKLKKHLKTIIQFQLKDNCKARVIDETQSNTYVVNDQKKYRSQLEIYTYFQQQLND